MYCRKDNHTTGTTLSAYVHRPKLSYNLASLKIDTDISKLRGMYSVRGFTTIVFIVLEVKNFRLPNRNYLSIMR
jgi:hypothetical protein